MDLIALIRTTCTIDRYLTDRRRCGCFTFIKDKECPVGRITWVVYCELMWICGRRIFVSTGYDLRSSTNCCIDYIKGDMILAIECGTTFFCYGVFIIGVLCFITCQERIGVS